MGALDGKVAIVTGAGRGLGRSHAHLLAAEGAKVVVNDIGFAREGGGRDERPAQEVVAEIKEAGGDAVANFESVSDWGGAERLVGQAVEEFGRLDVLVNNAGIIIRQPIAETSEEEFDAAVGVHLKGSFATSRFAVKHWQELAAKGEQVDGRIINTSSETCMVGLPLRSAYGSAKAAIVGLTLVLARELADSGIKVNAIAPRARTRMGGDLPPFSDPIPEDGFDKWDPANVSPVVAWLASPAAANVTGQVFVTFGSTVKVLDLFRPAGVVDFEDTQPTVAGLTEASDELFRDHDSGLTSTEELWQQVLTN